MNEMNIKGGVGMAQYPIADKKSPQNVLYSTEMVFSDAGIVRLKITKKSYLPTEKRKRINPTPSLPSLAMNASSVITILTLLLSLLERQYCSLTRTMTMP